MSDAEEVAVIILDALAVAAAKRWPFDSDDLPPITGHDLRDLFRNALRTFENRRGSDWGKE